MRPAATVAFAVLAIAIVLSAALVQSVLAASYTPALKTGDIAMYSLFGNYAHGTAYGQLKVLSVIGTNVTIDFTDYPLGGFANGGGSMWIDVSFGQTNNQTSGLYFAVAPGLRIGDPIFQGSTTALAAVPAVQGLNSNPCGGALRQVIGTQYYTKSGELINIAWDQNTGIMCNYGSNNQANGILGFTLDNTTLWSTAAAAQDVYLTAFEISTFLGAPLVLLIVYVYLRKRRKRGIDRASSLRPKPRLR